MTDTPTPPAMTPEQRAEFVAWLRRVRMRPTVADQLEADGETIATLTAERDAAQAEMAARIGSAREVISRLTKINVKLCADFNLMNQHGAKQDAEIARLTAALATAREDGMREVKEIKPTQAQIDDACLSYRHDYGLMTPANRALMRFEATEWLLAWGKTITKGAAI